MRFEDGQGAAYGDQGIGFDIRTVNAPAGSDAEAILAMDNPTQSTGYAEPIDLEFVLPSSIRTKSNTDEKMGGGAVSDFSKEVIIGVAAIVISTWLLRRA